MAIGLYNDLSKVYGAALSDSTRNDILDSAGMQQYMSDDEKKKREDEQKAKGMKKGGKVASASKRADGIAERGKTKGRIV